jgi:hypothetical protein
MAINKIDKIFSLFYIVHSRASYCNGTLKCQELIFSLAASCMDTGFWPVRMKQRAAKGFCRRFCSSSKRGMLFLSYSFQVSSGGKEIL